MSQQLSLAVLHAKNPFSLNQSPEDTKGFLIELGGFYRSAAHQRFFLLMGCRDLGEWPIVVPILSPTP